MPKLKQPDVPANRTRDLLRCVSHYLSITHCAGGRPIVTGYVCPHCLSVNPEDECDGVEMEES